MQTAKRGRPHRCHWDVLEPRLALSRPPGFGAVGDSLTDEYRFYPPDRSHARNWVETLAAVRRVDFGAFTTRDRGLPRDQGYANNWAKENATSTEVVGGQLPGLARQVATGRVTYASVGMGTIDFLFFAQRVATATLTGQPPADFAGELAAVSFTAAANFDATIGTLLAANPRARLVVQTSPDIRQVPIVAQVLAIPEARVAADAIATAQAGYNAHLREVVAANHRLALADVAALSVAFAGGTATTLPIGGIRLRLTTTGNNVRDAFLADQIHPGTVAQGLIANAVATAANSLGATIEPLTPVQIVRRARFVARNFRTAR